MLLRTSFTQKAYLKVVAILRSNGMKLIKVFVFIHLSGCHIYPSSRVFSPLPGTLEETVYPQVSFKVFPDDLRSNPKIYRDKIVFWTGIVQSARIENDVLTTDLKHHYWDMIFDHGVQKEVVFLSPRGEGFYQCRQILDEQKQGRKIGPPPLGVMMFTYGKLSRIRDDGVIELNCLPIFRALEQKWFSTDIWDYGRRYLLNGDKTDFKILKVPLF